MVYIPTSFFEVTILIDVKLRQDNPLSISKYKPKGSDRHHVGTVQRRAARFVYFP
jgi:hypothetical protein